MNDFSIRVRCLKTYKVRVYDNPGEFVRDKGLDKTKLNRVYRGLYRVLSNRAFGYEFNFVDEDFQGAFDAIRELRYELVTLDTELVAVSKTKGGQSHANGVAVARHLGFKDSGQVMRVARGFNNKIGGYFVYPHDKKIAKRLQTIIYLAKLLGLSSFTPAKIKSTKLNLRSILNRFDKKNGWMRYDLRAKLKKGIEAALVKGINSYHKDSYDRMSKEEIKERNRKVRTTLDLKRFYTHASFYVNRGDEYLGIFPTTSDASKELGIEKSVIDRAVLQMTHIPGYTFRLLTPEERFAYVTERGYYPKPPKIDIDEESVLGCHTLRIKR